MSEGIPAKTTKALNLEQSTLLPKAGTIRKPSTIEFTGATD